MDSSKNVEEKTKETSHKKALPKGKMRPPVRQTLTSYKRMLNANPLLQFQEAGIDVDEVLAQKSLDSLKLIPNSKTTQDSKPYIREFKKPESKPLMRTQSLKWPKSTGINKPPIVISGNGVISRNVPSSSNTQPKPEILPKYLPRIESRKLPLVVKAKVNSFPNGMRKPKQQTNNASKPKVQRNLPSKKEESSLRRSRSALDLPTKGQSFDPRQSGAKLNKTQSEEQLCLPSSNAFKHLSPIMGQSKEDRRFIFKTPSAYNRRSTRPYTPGSNRKSVLFQASTPAPVEMQRLQERLNKWLKSRGKPPASFHHLRVFGSDTRDKLPPLALAAIDDENKENVEVIQEKSESYENLNIIITTPEKKNVEVATELENKNGMTDGDLSKYAKEAMTELQKLIEEDYPSDQCLGWLELIREKYRKIDDEPEYWECRAALERSAGNVRNAVEFYKTAIIQGAEVNTVDKSLDQLLKKFSLLNISPGKAEQKSHGQENKERIVREARNVFKSSIIQFAIRERNMKKSKEETLLPAQAPSKQLVVTPVRRSTRLSRSAYINTSGVTLFTSLKEINLSSKEISFEKNKALLK